IEAADTSPPKRAAGFPIFGTRPARTWRLPTVVEKNMSMLESVPARSVPAPARVAAFRAKRPSATQSPHPSLAPGALCPAPPESAKSAHTSLPLTNQGTAPVLRDSLQGAKGAAQTSLQRHQEALLIDRTLQGWTEAFGDLITPHLDALSRFARLRLRSDTE